MNNLTKTGTLNINRLIAEAEALLLGEKLGNSNGAGASASTNCIDQRIQREIRRPLANVSIR